MLTSCRLWYLMKSHSNLSGWFFPNLSLLVTSWSLWPSSHNFKVVQYQSSTISPCCAEAWRHTLCMVPSPRWVKGNWTQSIPRAPACRAPWPAGTGSRIRTFASRPMPAPSLPVPSALQSKVSQYHRLLCSNTAAWRPLLYFKILLTSKWGRKRNSNN